MLNFLLVGHDTLENEKSISEDLFEIKIIDK